MPMFVAHIGATGIVNTEAPGKIPLIGPGIAFPSVGEYHRQVHRDSAVAVPSAVWPQPAQGAGKRYRSVYRS